MGKSRVKIKEHRKTTVTDRGGNIVENTVTVHASFRSEAEPQYYKTYCDNKVMVEMLTKGELFVLYSFVENMTFDDNIIRCGADDKLAICERHGISLKTFYRITQVLAENNVIKKISRSEYFINPYLYSKGDWKAVKAKRVRYDAVRGYKENNK